MIRSIKNFQRCRYADQFPIWNSGKKQPLCFQPCLKKRKIITLEMWEMWLYDILIEWYESCIKINYQNNFLRTEGLSINKMVNNVRYVRCGIKSSRGTWVGKLRRAGSKTAKRGVDRSRFEGWRRKRSQMSFVFNINTMEMRKRPHSRSMFGRLVILMPVP